MVRRHGPLIQPHYPRRNQYGPVGQWDGWHPTGFVALESAVGIGQLLQISNGSAVELNGDGCNLLLGQRTVLTVGLDLGDSVDHVHAGSDLAEGCILAIQMLGILMHDKELAACGVGGGGTGHAQNTALVLQIVLDAVEEKFALNAVAGATHAGALGAATLNHETGDDAVKDQAVIEVSAAQIDEVCNALGCLLGIQFALDDTAVFHGDLKSRICHFISILPLHNSTHFTESPIAADGDWHVPRLPLVGERHAYFYIHIKCGIPHLISLLHSTVDLAFCVFLGRCLSFIV